MKKTISTILIVLVLLSPSIASAEWGYRYANFWKQVGTTLQTWNTELSLLINGIEVNGKLVYTPSSDNLLDSWETLTVTNSIMRVAGNGGAVTSTSTPNIADGEDGQCVKIQGTHDTNTMTFQDADNLANSGLGLSGNVNFTMSKGDFLGLCYDLGDDLWYEYTRSDN